MFTEASASMQLRPSFAMGVRIGAEEGKEYPCTLKLNIFLTTFQKQDVFSSFQSW